MKREPAMPIYIWPAMAGLAAIGLAFIGYFVAALSIPVSSCPTEALCFANGGAGLVGALIAGVIGSYLSMKALRVEMPLVTLIISTVIAVVIFPKVMDFPYSPGTPGSVKFLFTALIFAIVLGLSNYLVRLATASASGRGRKRSKGAR